jgi:hypothetical protein
MGIASLPPSYAPVRRDGECLLCIKKVGKMERALAEEMVREILTSGKNLNRLNDLIEVHIADAGLKRNLRDL